jgi:plastocyanin
MAGGSQTAVLASDFVFTPANLTVRAGTTVMWTNTGGFHNVTADDGSFR